MDYAASLSRVLEKGKNSIRHRLSTEMLSHQYAPLMTMDSALQSSILTAFAAILGSAVGGLSSFATTFFSQRAASRRDSITKELANREVLYADLIKEATNLLIDSLDRTLDKPTNLIGLYSLAGRICLVSSEKVVLEADKVIETIIESYSSAPTTFWEVHDYHVKTNSNPLHAFAQACREERMEMLRQI